MRLATYSHLDEVRVGVVTGPDDNLRIHPLPAGTTCLQLVQSGLPAALNTVAKALSALETVSIPIDQVRLLPPLQPPTVRDFVAFEEHVEGVVQSVGDSAGVVPEWFEAPTFYFTNPYTLIGTGEDIAAPAGSHLLDFELEIAAVIGRAGQNVDPDTAHDHIFGYTVMNDFSARDLQRREMKVNLGPAKGKDFGTALGPWLVTADEFDEYHDTDGYLALEMSVTVNGVEIGRDLSSNMGWPFADLVAYASRDSWIHPGDILGSGTCGNGGCLAELWGRNGRQDPPPLRPGDVVSMTVEGIGTLTNTVVDGCGHASPPVRAARTRPRIRHRDTPLVAAAP